MADHRITIGALCTDCTVLAAPEAAAPLRARLDRTMRAMLPERLADALEPVLGGADGIVRIRRLRLDLSLTGPLEESALARLLAARIAAALRGALRRAQEEVRLWPDAPSYLASYVETRLGFDRVPDWAFPEFRALAQLSPAEAAAEVIKASPECLAELARRGRNAGDPGRIVARIGAERLAPLFTGPGGTGRAPARPDPVQLAPLTRILITATAGSGGDAPLAAALQAAMALLAVAPEGASPRVLAAARLVASLATLARAHSARHGTRFPPAMVSAPPAEIARALPSGWIELWRRDLTDPAVAAALLRCLPELQPAPRKPSRRSADAPKKPGHPAPMVRLQPRRVTSAFAGLGLLAPIAARHRLDRILAPRALNLAIRTTMAPEDQPALQVDALVNTLFPFDPRARELEVPAVPAELLAFLPEPARPGLAEMTGPEAWGGFLLARFADQLPGLRGSSPGYLQHQFLRRHGALETGETEVTLDLPGVPLGIVLKMAGMTGPQGRLPQLGDRLFVVTLGGRR